MLHSVDVGERKLASYRRVASAETIDRLIQLGNELRGLRILHLNATPYGGGVAELLRSIVPLLNDLGLVADWKIITGDNRFFEVTKAIHNGLQGAERPLTAQERDTYRATSEANAALLEEDYDIVVVHDPQPAAIPSLRGRGDARWIWRCHIDTAQPAPDAWSLIRPYLGAYDAVVFTMPEFVPPDLPVDRVEIIPPAIDPLSPKNLDLDEQTAREIVDWIGVERDRPLVTQISRFDPWKDPLGVIEAYRLAREREPELQLALVGSMALDDPEGWTIYRQIMAASEADPLIHVFTNLTGVGNIEVNAFQRLSDVVIQKSLREGFGLVVSEALWKGTPVVAGPAGGIPLQMADGAGGLFVESVSECADGVLELLRHPDRASELAARGRERVARHFLLPRLLLNELSLAGDLAAGRPTAPPPTPRDPVCGMALESDAEGPAVEQAGRRWSFCSEACRSQFLQHPRIP